jgi:hypothetical protein
MATFSAEKVMHVLILTQKWVRLHFGAIFLTNSSGHPVSDPSSGFLKIAPIFWRHFFGGRKVLGVEGKSKIDRHLINPRGIISLSWSFKKQAVRREGENVDEALCQN